MEGPVKQNSLKNLFKKKKFDWQSEDYKKKSINLLMETQKFNFYQDESQNKKEFIERFRKLLNG